MKEDFKLRLILGGTHNPCEEVNLGMNHFNKKYGMNPGYMEMNCMTGRKIFKSAAEHADTYLNNPPSKDGIVGAYQGYDIYLDDYLADNEIIFHSAKRRN